MAALCGALGCVLALGLAAPRSANARPAPQPGGRLTRANPTPFAASPLIVGASWTSGRYDPPPNQWGDILPTVWSDDGSTYVLMDDGGVDVPLSGGLWRQSLAHVTGAPPRLRFRRVGSSFPPPHTLRQINGNPDNDDGPLGPYYSIGLAEEGGIFYATQQLNWNWNANGPFTGLAGIAYSRDHGNTWNFVRKPFPAPLGNLSFVDGGGPGGAYPDGFVYAIGTEREFNASRLVVGRAHRGIASITDPAEWQWYAGTQPGTGSPVWASSPQAAVPALTWSSHITYPQMSYDAPLHRYLLTFTYSYSSRVPAVWKNGAELAILESPAPWGPFSFVAASKNFGPSNGYGAGFPSQWISSGGQDLWLKWAANFDGCARGLDCSGKYGFNLARVHLTVAPAAHGAAAKSRSHVVAGAALAGSAALLLGIVLLRRSSLREALARRGVLGGSSRQSPRRRAHGSAGGALRGAGRRPGGAEALLPRGVRLEDDRRLGDELHDGRDRGRRRHQRRDRRDARRRPRRGHVLRALGQRRGLARADPGARRANRRRADGHARRSQVGAVRRPRGPRRRAVRDGLRLYVDG